jgi:PAS domain S-box-containing protein
MSSTTEGVKLDRRSRYERNRAVTMMMNGGGGNRWARMLVAHWRLAYLGALLLLVVPLSIVAGVAGRVIASVGGYALYVLSLKLYYRWRPVVYDQEDFRLVRVCLDIVLAMVLGLTVAPFASSYSWVFLFPPAVASVVYFGLCRWSLLTWAASSLAILAVALLTGTTAGFGMTDVIAKSCALGAMVLIVGEVTSTVPQLRRSRQEGYALQDAATSMIQALGRRDRCQLLADAARAGISAADAAVVHVLGGADRDMLIALGSSHISLPDLGKTPMRWGQGIAGHAIQGHTTINTPDANNDPRYHPVQPPDLSINSLLSAPMYVGDRDVGTITVHSAKIGAFGSRDERFLTTLAAQGALALAGPDSYEAPSRRNAVLGDILRASQTFTVDVPLSQLLDTIAAEICRCTVFSMAVVNLIDDSGWEITAGGVAGVDAKGERKLRSVKIPVEVLRHYTVPDYRVSESYFISHDRQPDDHPLAPYGYEPDIKTVPGGWHPQDLLITPMWTRDRRSFSGYISVDAPTDGLKPSFDTYQTLELLASVAAKAVENARLYERARAEIEERKRAEHTLKQEQRRLQAFMDNVDDNIYFKDGESRFVRVNPAAARWFGANDPSEVEGKADCDLFTVEHARQALEDERRVMATGEPLKRKEEKETWLDGRETWVSTTKLPWYDDENGSVIGTFGISTDITERVLQERRRQECQVALADNTKQYTTLEGLAGYIVQTGATLLGWCECELYLDADDAAGPVRLATTAEGSCAVSTESPHTESGDAGPPCEGRWRECGAGGQSTAPTESDRLLVAVLDGNEGQHPGWLVARRPRHGPAFTEFDRELLETVAGQATTGIDRIRDIENRITAERRRLATGLHDAMNDLTAGVRWEAEIAMDELGEGHIEETAAALSRMYAAYHTVHHNLEYVRDGLGDQTLEREGLVAALKNKAEGTLPGQWKIEADLCERLSPEIEEVLYRIGFEAINNALKHADIKRRPGKYLLVLLERSGCQVRLWVADNGSGMSSEQASPRNWGWGLRQLNEHAHARGGNLLLLSEQERGTALCAVIHDSEHHR